MSFVERFIVQFPDFRQYAKYAFWAARRRPLYYFYFDRKCPERPERCIYIYIYIYQAYTA